MRAVATARPPLEAASLVVAVLVLAAVALAARDVVLAMSSNADYAAPLVMGRRAGDYPGSLLVTGNYAWWNGLWIVQALSRLPAYTTTSNYLPLGATLLTVLVLGATAARLWGAAAACVAVIVPLCVGNDSLATFATFSSRAPTWWTAAAVLLVALWAARRPAGSERLAWGVVAALTVIGAGATLAGDPLAWAAVMIPLAAAVLAAGASRAWRLAGVLTGLIVVIVVLRFGIGALAHDAGYRFTGAPAPLLPFAAWSGGSANVTLGIQEMWRGVGPVWLETTRGWLGAAAVLVAVGGGVTMVLGGVSHPGSTAAEPAARVVQRRIWVAFWLTAILACIGAFAVTSVSGPLGDPVVRYLLVVPFATGGLLAALAATFPRRRGFVVVPALVLGLVAAGTLSIDRPPELAQRHRAAISAITQAVQDYDLDVGYASYWSAYPIEQATDYRYQVLPVGPCSPGGSTLCRPFLHYVSGAFTPRRDARSFLLVDSTPSAVNGDPLTYVTRAPTGVTPERSIDVGDGLTLLVYPFDLAGSLGAPAARPPK